MHPVGIAIISYIYSVNAQITDPVKLVHADISKDLRSTCHWRIMNSALKRYGEVETKSTHSWYHVCSAFPRPGSQTGKRPQYLLSTRLLGY